MATTSIDNPSAVDTAAIASAVAASVPDNANVRAMCASAIASADLPSATDVNDILVGYGVATSDQLYGAAVQALGAQATAQASGDFVAGPIFRTYVSVSGAGTSGTILAAAGIGQKIQITRMWLSCKGAAGDFTIIDATTGDGTNGAHTFAIGANAPLGDGKYTLFESAANTAITYTKTTLMQVNMTIWYRLIAA